MSVRKLNKVGPTHFLWRGRAPKTMPGLLRGTSKSIFMLQNKAWKSPVCFGILATPFYIAIWTQKISYVSQIVLSTWNYRPQHAAFDNTSAQTFFRGHFENSGLGRQGPDIFESF